MYFESMDQCEITTRYHLTMVQKDAWRKVVDELYALCAQPTDWQDQRDERRRLEDFLIETMAEAVYDNSDEERPPYEWREEDSDIPVSQYTRGAAYARYASQFER